MIDEQPGETNQKDFTEYNDPDWQEVIIYEDKDPDGYIGTP